MENYIDEWTRFAKRVERQLVLIDGLYSDAYLGSVRSLVERLQNEVRHIGGLDAAEKQQSFLHINQIGSELKTTAHFANFDMG